jgi:hypothetical protein
MPGYQAVESVDEWRRAEGAEYASERTGDPDLLEERHAASRVTRYRRAVAADEPPAFFPRVFRHGGEKASGLVIGERKQSQLFASVEPGDDPRRPPAELSGAGVEKDGARKSRYGIHAL